MTFLGALVFPPRPPHVEHKEIDPETLPIHVEDMHFKTERTQVVKDISSEVETKVYIIKNSTKRLKYCAWMLHLSSLFWLLATSIPYILLADYTQSLDLEEYVLFHTQLLMLVRNHSINF